MPWSKIKLNTGDEITNIGFGTWTMGNGNQATDQVEQAIDVGFDHIDTAQVYRNETETGQGLRESGAKRSDLWVTTKFSGLKDVDSSIQDSVDKLGIAFVDLYLVHSPRLALGNIPGLWKKMEAIKDRGLAKNIGVSNFNVDDLKILLEDAKVVPAVNQILLHPYVYQQQLPIINFCRDRGIVIEAYSPLIPVTKQPGGPLDPVLERISKRTGATYDQILLAWNKAKGSVVLTTSSKRSRLEGYVKAGDLELTAEDIASIDGAGAQGPPKRCWLVDLLTFPHREPEPQSAPVSQAHSIPVGEKAQYNQEAIDVEAARDPAAEAAEAKRQRDAVYRRRVALVINAIILCFIVRILVREL